MCAPLLRITSRFWVYLGGIWKFTAKISAKKGLLLKPLATSNALICQMMFTICQTRAETHFFRRYLFTAKENGRHSKYCERAISNLNASCRQPAAPASQSLAKHFKISKLSTKCRRHRCHRCYATFLSYIWIAITRKLSLEKTILSQNFIKYKFVSPY